MSAFTLAGYQLIPMRQLHQKPYIERATFSGGVNLSARERNRARIAETEKLYVMHGTRQIIGSPEIIERLKKSIERAP